MDKINDGGPAFPEPVLDARGDPIALRNGMSLRDWFAGQALSGLLAEEGCGLEQPTMVRDAQRAYAMADAMLAERAKKDAAP